MTDYQTDLTGKPARFDGALRGRRISWRALATIMADRHIARAKDKGITEGGIIRALPEGHNSRIRAEVLSDLVLSGRARHVEKEPGPKGGPKSSRYHAGRGL